MALLKAAGHDVKQSHVLGDSDIHIVRDPRAIVVSWICHFILQRPELDPEKIRPHIDDVVAAMMSGKHHKMPWSVYVTRAAEQSWHTVRYRDLVTDPRAALLPIVDIGDAAVKVTNDAQASDSWMTMKYRQGDPDGWIDVMSIEQAEKLAYLFRPGMDAVGLY